MSFSLVPHFSRIDARVELAFVLRHVQAKFALCFRNESSKQANPAALVLAHRLMAKKVRIVL